MVESSSTRRTTSPAPAPPRRVLALSVDRRFTQEPRQQDLGGRAPADFRGHLHVSLGLARESVDHRQPQARALALRLGGEEGVEDSREHFVGHAHSGVRHADRYEVARREIAPGRGAFVKQNVLQRNR